MPLGDVVFGLKAKTSEAVDLEIDTASVHATEMVGVAVAWEGCAILQEGRLLEGGQAEASLGKGGEAGFGLEAETKTRHDVEAGYIARAERIRFGEFLIGTGEEIDLAAEAFI